MIDLQTELTRLLPSVDDLPRPPKSAPETGGILLTGATGLVGGSLLASILDSTEATVTCLVRGDTAEPERTLRTLGRWSDDWQSRLEVVRARLDAPGFGLEAGTCRRLAESVDRIYHSAARVHWLDSYEQLRPHNVDPTLEVLRFATALRQKDVHYVSTLAVALGGDRSRPVTEDEPAENMAGLEVGYLQSKWIAEQLLVRASRALRVKIYRAPYVLGDEESGVWVRAAHNFLSNFIATCIRTRATPEPTFRRLPMISASELARVILRVGRADDASLYHLFRWVDASEWTAAIAGVAGECRVVPMDEWLSLATNAGAGALATFIGANSKPSAKHPRGPFGHYMWTEWPPISDARAAEILSGSWSFRAAVERFFAR